MKVDRNINVVFAAILLFGACVFTACSKDDDEEVLGVDTTSRVDKYKDMESLAASDGVANCLEEQPILIQQLTYGRLK